MWPNQLRIVMNILALGIGNLGGPDLFIILLIVLVLFGAKKLPDLARSLGQSINEFSKAREEIDRELHNTGTESFSVAALPVYPAGRGGTARPATDVASAVPVGGMLQNAKFPLRKS
jgi:sec-independent protein translocase protein TatA